MPITVTSRFTRTAIAALVLCLAVSFVSGIISYRVYKRTTAMNAAVATIRTLGSAQGTYSRIYPDAGYARELRQLGPPPGQKCDLSNASSSHACLIDGYLACANQPCVRDGYSYSLTARDRKPGPAEDFTLLAIPSNLAESDIDFCSTAAGQIGWREHRPGPVSWMECQDFVPIPEFKDTARAIGAVSYWQDLAPTVFAISVSLPLVAFITFVLIKARRIRRIAGYVAVGLLIVAALVGAPWIAERQYGIRAALITAVWEMAAVFLFLLFIATRAALRARTLTTRLLGVLAILATLAVAIGIGELVNDLGRVWHSGGRFAQGCRFVAARIRSSPMRSGLMVS